MSSPRPDRRPFAGARTGFPIPSFPARARAGRIPGLLALVLLVLLPTWGSAQDRPLVSNEVTVSSQGAGITLEFEGGERFSADLRGGMLLLNGSEAGRYTPGDALDRAWRAILAEAIAADNGRAGTLLASWDPPGGLAGDAAASAEALRSGLRGALARPAASTLPAGAAPGTSTLQDPATNRSLLDILVQRPDRAVGLTQLLQSRDAADLDVRVGSDVRVETDDVVEGSLLVLEGNVEVEGRVTGDLLVLGGDLRLGEEARIDGDVRILDGRLLGQRDAVRGTLTELASEAPSAASLRSELESMRDEIRAEVERGLRDGVRETSGARQSRETRSSGGFFRNLVSGVGGLLQTAVTFALLLGIGMGILYFFPRHFEVVARTASHVPGRSLAVGWAGLLLSPFAWIFGIIFLTATIIGIPVMLLWLPLFWVALAAAVLFGFLVVSRNLGAWWVHRRDAYHPQGLDTEQPAARLGVGLVLLLASFAGASILEIGGPIFTIFQVFLVVVGSLAAVNVAAMGLGAVLLSRAGRDRRWTGGADDLGYGDDPFEPGPPFGPEPPFTPEPPSDSEEEAPHARA
jgi:hypothetical protein